MNEFELKKINYLDMFKLFRRSNTYAKKNKLFRYA